MSGKTIKGAISIQQSPGQDLQRSRQLLHHRHRRVTLPPLDVADVGPVNAGAFGVVLLAPSLLLAETTHVLAEALTDVHGKSTTPLSAINLQTISHIGVDLSRPIERYVSHRRQEAARKMDDSEGLARSVAASASIRAKHQVRQKKWNLILIFAALAGLILYFIASARSGSGSSISDVQYQVAAETLIKQRLRDPSSAEFSSLEVHRVPGRPVVVCGLVNSRNGFGGMSGPQPFIAGEEVLFGQDVPSRYMTDEWKRQC